MNTIDDLIEYIKKLTAKSFLGGCAGAVNSQNVIDACEELKTNMEADDAWISIDDRFPPIGIDLILFRPGHHIEYLFAHLINQTQVTAYGGKWHGLIKEFSHYHYLPKPPKEKQS